MPVEKLTGINTNYYIAMVPAKKKKREKRGYCHMPLKIPGGSIVFKGLGAKLSLKMKSFFRIASFPFSSCFSKTHIWL